MKMMRKNWKDRKGVSPVIATILMVAITVVLAAVLYVMVMGFGNDPADTPKVALNKVDNGNGNYTVSVLSVSSGSIDFNNVNVVASPANLVEAGGDGADTITLKKASTTATVLSAGDYVQFEGKATGKVTITLVDKASGNGLGSITLDVKAPA